MSYITESGSVNLNAINEDLAKYQAKIENLENRYNNNPIFSDMPLKHKDDITKENILEGLNVIREAIESDGLHSSTVSEYNGHVDKLKMDLYELELESTRRKHNIGKGSLIKRAAYTFSRRSA